MRTRGKANSAKSAKGEMKKAYTDTVLEVTLTGDLQFGVQWYLAGLIGTGTGSAQANGSYNYTYPPGSNGSTDFTGNSHDRHRASLGATGNVGSTNNGGLFYSFLNNKTSNQYIYTFPY